MAEDQTQPQEPIEQPSDPDPYRKRPGLQRLNKRQKSFIRQFIKNGGHVVDAARVAGYPFPSAQGTRVFRDIMKRPEIAEKMESLGLTDEALLKPIQDALLANKSASFEGQVIESTVPDHDIRLKASEVGFKLNGVIQQKVENNTFNNGKVMVVYVNPTGEPDSSGEDLLRPTLPSSEGDTPPPGEVQDT